MAIDFTHLDALSERLAHELQRPVSELRKVWIVQIECEIAAERLFLGLSPELEMTDDELLDELGL